jgi:carboxymethylenebutenolidase
MEPDMTADLTGCTFLRHTVLIALSAFSLVSSVTAAGQPAPTAGIVKERVTFKSGGLTLVGFLFKPNGPGPFPGLIWNHGSEQNPRAGPQFDSVAAIFVPAGYVVFAPTRRGHGNSEGAYITDEIARVRQARGATEAERAMVHFMETEQLDDQLAGLSYLKRLAYVDTTRVVVAGCSYGGIETLLAAERGAGFKAAISISPAALSWNGNPLLQERLVKAVSKINIPVFLIQPPKDASLEPSRVLGAEFKRLGKPYTGKIYAAADLSDDEQTHCFGGAKGMHVWARDAVAFLSGVVK